MTFLFPLFLALLIGSLQANEEVSLFCNDKTIQKVISKIIMLSNIKPPEEEENIGGPTALTRSTR